MNHPITRDELRTYLTAFRYTAYRLELLDWYDEPAEADAFATWQAGGQPAIYRGKRDWQATVRRAAGRGAKMQRVHIVTGPLTDYLKFEFDWSYRQNLAAGEEILIWPFIPQIDQVRIAGLNDYWLFDSQALVVMTYDEQGKLTRLTSVTDPALIVEANRQRDAALHSAIPLDQFEEGSRVKHAM